MRLTGLVLLAGLLVACDDDSPAEPAPPPAGLVASYNMSQLRFDPQGSLPELDLRARLEGSIPQLVLARNGAAQLVFTDPETRLVTISNGSYTVLQEDRVRVKFNDSSTLFRGVMLSEEMTFTYTVANGTLVFADTSPDGVSRQRLIQLAPELADEQLFDPVPGRLTVIFAVAPMP